MKSSGTIFLLVALCFVGLSLMPFSGMGQTLPGAIYYWPADGDALDHVGGNNGHLFGGAIFGPGLIGQAFDLTGSGDKVYMDQPFPAMNIGDDYSVSLWMMMTSPPIDWGCLLTTRPDDLTGFFELGVNTDGSPFVVGYCDGSPQHYYCPGPATPVDEWQHVAAVFNWTASTIEFYVNGEQAGTCDLTECDGLTNSDKIYLGASFDDFPGWEFTGFLDEIQVYDRALDGTEIQWLYEQSVSDVPNGATTIIKLYDASPNPFNPQTTISFELPRDQTVSLRVYDVAGRLVEIMFDDEIGQSGRNAIVWNGRDAAGRIMPAGVYYYRLEAGTYVETKRMTLLK